MTRTLRPGPALVLLVIATVALAGCQQRVAGPRTWTMSADLAAGGSSTVTVQDTSGRIDNVEFDPTGVDRFGPIVNPPGQPSVVIVPWAGGACDVRTVIDIAANGQGLGLTVRPTSKGTVCPMMAVGHALRLTAREPLPAASVTVTTAPTTGG